MQSHLQYVPRSRKSLQINNSSYDMLLFLPCDSPGSAFADSSLVVCLFVVQLIVGAVFAFGSSWNHRPWLIPITRLSPCRVPWGCTEGKGQRQIGYIGLNWKKRSLTPKDSWLMACISICITERKGHIGGELTHHWRCKTTANQPTWSVCAHFILHRLLRNIWGLCVLIFITYLGHPARSCVSVTRNVNYSTEKRGSFHWNHPHFSTDSLMQKPFHWGCRGWINIFSILHFKGHSSCLICEFTDLCDKPIKLMELVQYYITVPGISFVER